MSERGFNNEDGERGFNKAHRLHASKISRRMKDEGRGEDKRATAVYSSVNEDGERGFNKAHRLHSPRKAMILAAGLGKRMGNLTQDTPKALLTVNHKPLIVYRIEQLVSAGVEEIIINVHQHREAFQSTLSDGKRFACRIQYSLEDDVLETAGGIIQALPLLGNEPFIIASCDTLTDFNFSTLMTHELGEHLAHLILVDNPPHHPDGDYGLIGSQLSLDAEPKYNYAGFGLLHPQLFAGLAHGKRKKADVFAQAIPKGLITGEHYQGQWMNIDTPERLAQAHGNTR